jgi:hypothetical protein
LEEAGVLCLLLLVALLDRAPDQANALLAAALADGVPEVSTASSARAAGAAGSQLDEPVQAVLGFSLLEVAVRVTGWLRRALASGTLADSARQQGSYLEAAGEARLQAPA